MTKTNQAASPPALAARRAAAALAGYALVPVPAILRLREAANTNGLRVNREVRRGR